MKHTNEKNIFVKKIESSKSKIMKLAMASLLLATLSWCGGSCREEKLQQENERLEIESKTEREIKQQERKIETENQKAQMEAARQESEKIPQVYSWREETDKYIIIHQESNFGAYSEVRIPKGFSYDVEVTSWISVTNAAKGTREAENTMVVESWKMQNVDAQDVSDTIVEEQILDVVNDTINKE